MSAASHTPGPWTDFPPRQITGKPTRYYGYIGHERLEEHCCAAGDPPGTHRHPRLAVACARRAATKRNNVEERVKYPCGCTNYISEGDFEWCLLHKAASELAAALKEMVGGALDRDEEDVIDADRARIAFDRARAALKKAGIL